MNILGERIKKKREELNLNISELAEKADSNSVTIGQIERGNHKNPNFSLIMKLSEILDVSIDWLVGKEEIISHAEYQMLNESERSFLREYVEFVIKRKKG